MGRPGAPGVGGVQAEADPFESVAPATSNTKPVPNLTAPPRTPSRAVGHGAHEAVYVAGNPRTPATLGSLSIG